jgi:hypothetical protein
MLGLTAKMIEHKVFKGNKNHSKKKRSSLHRSGDFNFPTNQQWVI